MIHIFLGFPGDGKTTSLLNFCQRDEVSKESKPRFGKKIQG